jgi:hypothetical protein
MSRFPSLSTLTMDNLSTHPLLCSTLWIIALEGYFEFTISLNMYALNLKSSGRVA